MPDPTLNTRCPGAAPEAEWNVTRRRRFLSRAGAAAACLAFAPAFGETWPSRSVKIIVPWPAGGTGDLWTRLVADRLSPELGQPFVVENRPGAAGTVGLAVAARATPDGYTLVFGSINDLALAPATLKELPFDPERDFAPIIELGTAPQVLVAGKSSTAKSIREFVAELQRRTEPARQGTAGPGGTGHFVGIVLGRAIGVTFNLVPYKGQAPVATAIASGEVDFGLQYLASALPMVESGHLRPLLVLGPRRLVALPGVPCAPEAGFPQLDFVGWSGFLAPAHTPPSVITRANEAVGRILRRPDVIQTLARSGAQVTGGPPEAFAARIRSERARWARLVAEAGIAPP